MVNSGSFAPPLTDELLDSYEALVEGLSGRTEMAETVTALKMLIGCCRKWWDLPESSDRGSRPHPCGLGIHNPLDLPQAAALASCVPGIDKLQAMGRLFDSLKGDTLRNCAFHLLWHANELAIGREPMTLDKI